MSFHIFKDGIYMKTAETINLVCADMGVSKADLAKRMGLLPSSFYRKLSRESMTFEEFQKCLDMLGITIEFNLKYPNGNVRSSREHQEMLLGKISLLEAQLEAAKKAAEYHRSALRDLRTELNSAVGYAQLLGKGSKEAEPYLDKLQLALQNMEEAVNASLDEVQEESNAEEPFDMELLQGRRVLLVDDNEMNREIAREILMDHGLIVEEAADGGEALEAVQTKEPGYYHFILMDIEMPGMDGYETTVRIRKLPNRIRSNVPIIALTANVFPEDRERAKAVGMDDFLTKPVNSARLLGSLVRYA